MLQLIRRIRHKNAREESDYETLPDYYGKRSFKNLLHRSTSKKRCHGEFTKTYLDRIHI